MPFIRRARGAMLRLTRHRALAIAIGLALALPAGWIECFARDVPGWLEGLSLIAGATGIALVWTGATGAKADWIEKS